MGNEWSSHGRNGCVFLATLDSREVFKGRGNRIFPHLPNTFILRSTLHSSFFTPHTRSANSQWFTSTTPVPTAIPLPYPAGPLPFSVGPRFLSVRPSKLRRPPPMPGTCTCNGIARVARRISQKLMKVPVSAIVAPSNDTISHIFLQIPRLWKLRIRMRRESKAMPG